MLKWKLFSSRYVAIGYLIIITLLFCLPGSAFPKDNWLTRIGFDKIVHICFFAALLFLWRNAFSEAHNNITILLLFSSFLYGLLIEIIQSKWVPNRSFDAYDIVADSAGAVIGIYVWWRYIKK